MVKMSFIPADDETKKRLHELYYDKKFFVGRDRLWHVYKEKYSDKPISQRSVLDWLKHQTIWQQYRVPLKRGSIAPVVASKRGHLSLDCVQMEPYNGYNTIYNLVDVFSKRLYSKAMKGQTANNTVRFFQEIMEKYPNIKLSVITCDNGSEFKEPFRTWCREQGITLQFTKPHSPQSNPVERYNKTQKTMLNMAMKVDNTSDWVSLLQTIVDNMNSSYSFSTKEVPLALDQSTDKNLHKKVTSIVENRAAKKYGVKTKGGTDITPGSLVRKVLDYDPSKILKKSKTGYFGKEVYKVISVIPSKYPNGLPSYRIAENETGKPLTGQWGRWQLLPIPEDTFDNIEQQERRPGPAEGTEEYEIQSIVDKMKMRNGQVKYRVRWKGWSAKDDTWEPRRKLVKDVPELIEAYETAHS